MPWLIMFVIWIHCEVYQVLRLGFMERLVRVLVSRGVFEKFMEQLLGCDAHLCYNSSFIDQRKLLKY
jgi:hypothetical protein